MSGVPQPDGFVAPAGSDAHDLFAAERAHLMGVAYRLLGSVADAEDVLQDVFERWLGHDRSTVDNPAAYLTTMTTRVGIDRLRSARAKREVYVGPWLPEPLPTPDDPANPAAVALLDESLTIGYLHLLEQLTPLERAAYLLHDVFDFSYREIAPMIEREEANCRQLASRARSKLRATRPREVRHATPEAEAEVCASLLGAVMTGDVDQVMALMTEDVVHISDGGEHHRAARQPVVGRDRVARFMINLARRLPSQDEAAMEVRMMRVNLQPGLLIIIDGRPFTLVIVESDGLLARRIYAVVNPAKLQAVMEAGA